VKVAASIEFSDRFRRDPRLARPKEIIADPVEMNRHSVANIWTKLRYASRWKSARPR
jgi:hypothetical protein